MTRTIALLLTLAAIGLVVCACVYLLHCAAVAPVLFAVGSILTAVIAGGVVAILNRTTPEKPCAPPAVE